MSMLSELKERKAGLIEKARRIHARAEKEGRAPNSEERSEFDRLIGEVDRLKPAIADAETEDRRLTWLDTLGIGRTTRFWYSEDQERRAARVADITTSISYRRSFLRAVLGGRELHPIPPEFEHRDTNLSADSKGGYLFMPAALAARVYQVLDSVIGVRPLASRFTLTSDTVVWPTQNPSNAKGINVPVVSTTMGDPQWTTDVQAVTEDTTMAFSAYAFTPYPLTKLAKMSMRFEKSVADADVKIIDQLAYAFARTEEKYFLVGTGSSQPLGIFTASASGIPSSRDVSTGNSTTLIGSDNLMEMRQTLSAAYRSDPSTRWIWSAAAVKAFYTMKDSNNHYILEPAVTPGGSDMLLGYGVIESAYCPATFTTGQYVGALGAMRYYGIGEVEELVVQKLSERYAATNEIGLIARHFVDGGPLVGSAFVRSKLA